MTCYHTKAAGSLLVLICMLLPAATNAQAAEQEPNNSCPEAQLIGQLPALPATVSGSLDGNQQTNDVDFFAFEFIAGSELRLELRGAGSAQGTLGDPFVGVFDSDCNLLALNDDSTLGLESRLDFLVPDNGLFTVAATGCCDFDFSGAHGQAGSYVLHILNPPPAIGSISGRLVDARSGDPLAGNLPPYGFVELFRCDGSSCFEYAAFAAADGDGRFSISHDYAGTPLRAGSYLVTARANGYEFSATGPFPVGEAEHVDVGDVALQPPPITFSNIQPCTDIPAAGGWCFYSFDIQNNSDEEIRVLGWSNVQASSTGSPLGYSFFSAERRQALTIPAAQSATVNFRIGVPSRIANGAFLCTDGYVSDVGGAFLGTLHAEFLFCVSKQFGRFEVMNKNDALARLRQMEQLKYRAAKMPQ